MMSEELEAMLAKTAVGIKQVKKKQKLSLKTFSESPCFYDRDEGKDFVAGKGIVHSLTDNIHTFDCGCLASKDEYGGKCEDGHVVCKECLFICAHEGCFRRLCTVPQCLSRMTVRGRMFCRSHGIIALILSILGLLEHRAGQERRMSHAEAEIQTRSAVPRPVVHANNAGQRLIESSNNGNVPRRSFRPERHEGNGRISR
jgi:hypothetical protein